MQMDAFFQVAVRIIEVGALLFAFLLAVLVLVGIYMYVVDSTQKQQTIRRNYPILGRFRYFFEHMGEFFRQYFFALDREELPFNRAQRSWVYRAAKNIDSTVAFGSTRPNNNPGDIQLLNALFPVLQKNAAAPAEIVFGEGYAVSPFKTHSFYNISGMSFGAISKPAVRALSIGAKKAGVWMNTGEGALSPFHLEGGCDLVFQIGTAKYGVQDARGGLSDERLRNIAANKQVKMFEIKLSQGAKPGKGGILPGAKVTAEIAAIRGIPEGQDSISPNGHREITSIGELLDMIVHVRKVTGKPVGFKVAVGGSEWLDELCTAIHRRSLDTAPDFITIDSADGGTGAAPQSLIDYMGLPIRRSLPLVVDKLVEYSLRRRIKVIASGKLINPSDVAWGLCMGADVVVSARGFMFSLGCIQALQCNKNTCPTGITTHDPDLQNGLVVEDKAERVYHFAKNMQHEVEIIAHSCGVKEPHQLGREHINLNDALGIPRPSTDVFPLPQIRSEYIIASDVQQEINEAMRRE